MMEQEADPCRQAGEGHSTGSQHLHGNKLNQCHCTTM